MFLSLFLASAAAQELTPVDIGVDLAPTVGTSSSMMGTDLRAISLSLFGGYAGAVDGVELSMGVNIERYYLSGVQLGFANLVGTDVDGIQGASMVNVVGRDVDGVQMSGGVNLVGGVMDGVQMAGGLNVVGGMMDGVQLSGGVNLASEVDGAQIAPVNFAGGHVDGVQIGIVNVARTSDFSLGVVNIILEGRTHLDVTVDELGLGTVAFKHGGAGFHYIYSIGARPGPYGAVMPAIGMGGHRPWRRMFVDADVITGQLFEQNGSRGLNLRTTGRLLGGLTLTDRLSLIAGPSYNLLVTDVCGPKYGGLGSSVFSPGPVMALGWPGFVVGVELL